VLGTTVVSAAISLETSASYDGTDAESQAISSEVVISPDDAKISDVVIRVRETDQAFVDFDSFERSINPGNADVDITYTGDGRFEISELEPDETLRVSFDAYPRTIKEQSIDAATIEVEYVQQGQSLSDQQTVSADLSSSSWFELQDAQSSLQTQQTTFYGAVGVIVLVLLGGIGFAYKQYGGGGSGGTGGDDNPFSD
jgi:hypothetical protein